MRSDLHLNSARANSLELLDRISGAEFLIFAQASFCKAVLAQRLLIMDTRRPKMSRWEAQLRAKDRGFPRAARFH